MENEAATVCSMVPSLLEFLLSEGARTAPAHFREVLCGAGPLTPDTVIDFERAFGIPVRHLYGLSEITVIATLMPRLSSRPGRWSPRRQASGTELEGRLVGAARAHSRLDA